MHGDSTGGRFRDSPCFPCGRHLPLPFPETYAKDRACLLVKNVRVRISLDYRLVNSRVTGPRARLALGALDREAADAAVLDLLWRRSARSYSSPTPTRVSACISQAARRRSKTQPRARAGATSREAVVRTGSSRARPSRVPDAHASAMIPRRLGAAAASAAPPTGALRGVLLDQSALPTTRVEEDQCSAAPSLSSRPSLRT